MHQIEDARAAGRHAARISASTQAQPGVHCAGLNTTVLPNASAGAIFHAGIAIGKFHGVISPTTPTGSRVISTSTPGRTDGSFSPGSRSASPAKNLKMCPARTVSPMPSGSVFPSSRASSRPDLVLAREDVGARLVEDVRAILDRADGPRGECALGRRNRRVRLPATSACAYSPMTSRDPRDCGWASMTRPRTHSPPM